MLSVTSSIDGHVALQHGLRWKKVKTALHGAKPVAFRTAPPDIEDFFHGQTRMGCQADVYELQYAVL